MTANPSNNHTTMFKCKLLNRKNAITNVISNNKNSYTSINYYGSTKYFCCGKNSIDPRQSQEIIMVRLRSSGGRPILTAYHFCPPPSIRWKSWSPVVQNSDSESVHQVAGAKIFVRRPHGQVDVWTVPGRLYASEEA